jgi:hypothetical protein
VIATCSAVLLFAAHTISADETCILRLARTPDVKQGPKGKDKVCLELAPHAGLDDS